MANIKMNTLNNTIKLNNKIFKNILNVVKYYNTKLYDLQARVNNWRYCDFRMKITKRRFMLKVV